MSPFAKRGVLSVALVLLLLAITPLLHAKKLYKYQDEQGRWQYTDKAPASDQPVETQQLRINEIQTRISIRNRGHRSEPLLYIVNEYRGPIEVEMRLNGHKNIGSQPKLPARFTVPASSEIKAVKLFPLDKAKPWRYQYGYRAVLGDPKAKHRPPDPYLPPFEPGQTFPITQGFRGKYSHHDPQSEYAVDIAMPEGTPIRAARSGVVVNVANDFYSGGVSNMDRYIRRANIVRILHDDGTMAVYAHLKLETAKVFPGIRVARGQLIAESGNTGYSSGPHLHFVIQKNAGMELVSVPFTFADSQGKEITPRQGMGLSASQ